MVADAARSVTIIAFGVSLMTTSAEAACWRDGRVMGNAAAITIAVSTRAARRV
jgi:hypothetical protein